ncbi:PLP-dependent cysteine synthase family protein [Leptospira sp. GIMC2001]|uniref:PLP-dependent cysteine synthase family protein n=1 Tax=Leptospira sp. GIMC2001 TaxID=1513297 RepID=UPI00234983A5|nr:pyridoxal-phosphate dependent enzyme [Leptospira sp. GIMC2001]WCL47888.1 pyridoxal-phosphate dependent enzyme [Leptospira sp. GIMC2001]
MIDQISKSIDELGNGIINALNDIQGMFGKELSVANPVKNSILDLVGNTPIIRLNQIGSHIPGINFYLKAEFQNPTGSLRDRSAIAMIRDAEKRNKLKKNGTILTSGTGSSSLSFSWAGRTMGYKIKCLVSEGTDQEKIQKLSHYGADVEVVSGDPKDSILKYSGNSNFWYPDENSNMANPNHHFARTGPEIYRDLGGKVDIFVTGGGTGASVTGIGRFFRSIRPKTNTQVVLSGFKNSNFDLYFSTTNKEKVPIPEIFDPSVVAEFIAVTKEEALHYQSDLLIKEGIPVGITTGMILCAAIRYAEKLDVTSIPEPRNLVILCPDRE